MYDDTGLYVFFKVNDRYVRCEYSDYQDRVCRDSCVQFFVKPKADKPYFNLEMNCGGTLLFYQMEDPTMVNGYHKKYTEVEKSLADEMRIYHSMPQTVMPEIAAPVEWKVEYFVPFKLFEYYLGPLGKIAGQTWRATLHKCADKSSHPHWATWAPIGEVLSFHKPECFAPIRFEAK